MNDEARKRAVERSARFLCVATQGDVHRTTPDPEHLAPTEPPCAHHRWLVGTALDASGLLGDLEEAERLRDEYRASIQVVGNDARKWMEKWLEEHETNELAFAVCKKLAQELSFMCGGRAQHLEGWRQYQDLKQRRATEES